MIFPPSIDSLLKEIREKFELCLVGGGARLLLHSELANDLDFEVRSSELKLNDWSEFASDLAKKYQGKFNVYKILQINYKGFSLEFSAPRKEEINGVAGHHYFTPHYQLDLDVKSALARRDLTLNAFYLKFSAKLDEYEIIDPYGGIDDLNKNIIRHVSGDFKHDPVRYFRAFRFLSDFDKARFAEETRELLVDFQWDFERDGKYLLQEIKKANDPSKMLRLILSFYEGHSYEYPCEFTLKEAMAFIDAKLSLVGKYSNILSELAKLFSVSFLNESSWQCLMKRSAVESFSEYQKLPHKDEFERALAQLKRNYPSQLFDLWKWPLKVEYPSEIAAKERQNFYAYKVYKAKAPSH